MGYFPFFTDVSKLHGVVIGGGSIAAEKVMRLAAFDAKLTVVAPSICDEIREYGDCVEIVENNYDSHFLEYADYVIAATNIQELNERIYRDAKERKLLINVVDVPEKCDFIFPSVIQRGKLVIGVSSSGAGPQVAIRLRKEIEKNLPEHIEQILDYLAEERLRVKETMPDPLERKKYLIELADRLLGYEEE